MELKSRLWQGCLLLGALGENPFLAFFSVQRLPTFLGPWSAVASLQPLLPLSHLIPSDSLAWISQGLCIRSSQIVDISSPMLRSLICK